MNSCAFGRGMKAASLCSAVQWCVFHGKLQIMTRDSHSGEFASLFLCLFVVKLW